MLEDERKEELLEVLSPLQLERCLLNLMLPRQSLRELLMPSWFLFPHVARGRPEIVSASGRPDLWSGDRLLARLGPPRECGCRFYILDEI